MLLLWQLKPLHLNQDIGWKDWMCCTGGLSWGTTRGLYVNQHFRHLSPSSCYSQSGNNSLACIRVLNQCGERWSGPWLNRALPLAATGHRFATLSWAGLLSSVSGGWVGPTVPRSLRGNLHFLPRDWLLRQGCHPLQRKQQHRNQDQVQQNKTMLHLWYHWKKEGKGAHAPNEPALSFPSFFFCWEDQAWTCRWWILIWAGVMYFCVMHALFGAQLVLVFGASSSWHLPVIGHLFL